ncbi:MAG: DUF2442 domain-containing protein [Chlamydiae bacterium]|nr:DUF2442 domain-containing protein [Chlamydiota bacterium]MBI3277969.1 DUF2442 domain-containing protein [Chlamydiota bacterium]
MYWVVKAEYVENFKIRVFFNDKIEGIVDLHEMVHHDHRSIVKELKDEKRFKKFKVEMDTIVWENGLDLAPEFLHDKVQR